MKNARRPSARQKGPSQFELIKLSRLFDEKQTHEAETLARTLTQRFPHDGFAWKVLGAIYQNQGFYQKSVGATRKAIDLLPQDPATFNNLGTALLGLGNLNEALMSIQQALSIAPDYAKALTNLGIVLRLQGHLPESEDQCRLAIKSAPNSAQAHMALGNALELQNKLSQALDSYRTTLQLNPEEVTLYSDVLNLLSLDDRLTPNELAQAHMAFGDHFEPPLQIQHKPHTNNRDPHRQLRIGFVTSDLYNHALASYLEPLFKGLAPKQSLQLHAYYAGSVKDATTRRIRGFFAFWHDVSQLNDTQLADQIRLDQIDILVDLNGHTLPNRLLAFARKPTPVQMSWVGYLGTTGLRSMDYYVADRWWMPQGQWAQQFSEKLAYLPCAMVFEPDPLAPPVNALPALSNGFITFGSFNRLNKINHTVIVTWGEILRRVPTAKLMLVGIASDFQGDLLNQFEVEGVQRERLQFLPRAVTHEYLALHHQVDLCLDTFPFGSGATSAHAAWMGVPTVCWMGDKPASRFGAAQFHHLGLDDFIAHNAQEFVALACDWANRPDALAAVRQGLRERFIKSPLCDFERFSAYFETLFRTVWQRWCAGQPADTVTIGSHMTEISCDKSSLITEPSVLEQEKLHELYLQQRYQEAETLARELIAKFPDHGLARKILGAVLHQLGRFKESLVAHKTTVQYRPQDHEAHFNLASELQQQGLLDDAVKSYLNALGLQPNNPNAYNNLGNIFKTMGLNAQAEGFCRQAIALQPQMERAHNNLGNALHAQGRYVEAVSSYRQALALKPDWADALNNLAIVLKDMGDSDAAQAAYRAALKLKPDWAAAHSNLLFCLSLDVNTTPQELHEHHLAFGAQFEAKQALRTPLSNSKDPNRQLKVGFVSGDFYDHALANFFEPLFRELSKSPGLELHAYYVHIYDDAVTRRLHDCFQVWNQVSALTESALAEKIAGDGIDILFDLSGHSAYNRLLTFALKPAPIQVSYLGYLGTTGLKAMDYFLCDKTWLPPELTWQLKEKPAYLPSAIVFQPSDLAPPVNELPALTNGYVTFGSFNRPNKINASMVMLWSMLLRNVPTARLVFGGMPQDCQNTLRQSFAGEGIALERLTFFERSNLPTYLALHHHVDFCLDTYPHGGGATTANAAWMGVPSLCLAGETPASRLGAMEMQHLDLDGFVATSIDDYLEKAQYWATHLTELAQIRAGMRQRFSSSALFQYADHAHNFESMLRTMWQRWCDDLPTAVIDVAPTKSTMQPFSEPPTPTALSQEQIEHLTGLYEAKDYPATHALANDLTRQFPNAGFPWKILGLVYLSQEKYFESIAPLRRSLALEPGDAATHNNLGMALVAQNFADEAYQQFQLALNADPGYGKAYVNLAMVQQFQGQLDLAESSCKTAIALDEHDASAYIQLGKVLEEKGLLSQAQACYYRADMAHEPRREVAHSNVLYLLNHDVLVEPQHLFEEHLAFGARFETPLLAQQQAHTNDKNPDRVLNIGFVSGDFNHHALAYFLEPLFEQLSLKRDLITHAFYTRSKEDDFTQRMRTHFAKWHSVTSLDDDELATYIRAEQIDILIDLTGHTAKNRLLTFARKPAPIQASWLGYLGTTGLKSMDYYISDAYWIPPGELDWQFAEKMAYLPSVVTFQPSALSPPVNALPALSHGALTFGSFNRANKINTSVIALWSMLLRSIPSSRLLLGAIENEAQDDLLQSFAAEKIDASRIRFYPRVATPDYLALHHQVDICLDTFPHAGGATTAHAAWMGVPTLGLAGQTPASRFGAAVMHQLGLDDFVAGSIEEFVHIGRYWSQHIDALAELRASMRQRFSGSALGQSGEFATSFETMLRDMWMGWCKDAVPQSMGTNCYNKNSINPMARVEPSQSEIPSVVVISASKLSESAFWAQSALGQSLRRLSQQGENISVDIAFENSRGLPEIFNAAIRRAKDDDILVFMHDDVWLDEYHFSQTVAEGLQQFDVIGVAGNKRRLPNQPAWCFVDQQFTWDDKSNLSGHVGHGANAFGQLSDFGEVPAACELLDGVFLATHKKSLTSSQVRFDPMFDFHFYDMDFCHVARKAGLKLGTWSVRLTHQSGGAFGSQDWQRNFLRYQEKVNDVLLPMKQTPLHDRYNPDLLKIIPDGLKKIVEVGCSSGALAKAYMANNPDCEYVGIEIDPEYATIARQFCSEVLTENIESISDEVFSKLINADAWIFGDALEHLYDPWKVLNRIKKYSPPGTLVLSCIPNAQHWSLIANLALGTFRYQDSGLLDRTHIRWFTRLTMIELFESTGFSIIQGFPRIFNEPGKESVIPYIGALVTSLGGDAKDAMENALPLQYIIKAISIK